MIIIVDVTRPVFAYAAGDDSVYATRSFVVLTLSYLVAFPLCCLQSFKSLSWSSIVGIATIAYVAFVITFRGAERINTQGVPSSVHWFEGNLAVAFALPILAFVWQSHLSVIPIYVELDTKRKSIASMRYIMFITCAITAVIYGVIGYMGYLTWGSDTQSGILFNWPLTDIFMNTAKYVRGV
jgi:sodium-coupled neutral amino acid transporter 11